MSTDFVSIAPEASSTEPTVEQRGKAALRAWDLTGLLLLLVLAGLFFGGSGLVLYLHSIYRSPPIPSPIPSPIVFQDDASAIEALVELNRLSFSMELAQADQAFARWEDALSRWRQLYHETLKDDVGSRIAGNKTLFARFIVLSEMNGPEQFSSISYDRLKELAEEAETTNDERTLQNLTQKATGIRDHAITGYTDHQTGVQLLAKLREDATGLPATKESLAMALKSRVESLAEDRRRKVGLAAKETKRILDEQQRELDELVTKQQGLADNLEDQLALIKNGESIQPTNGLQGSSPPASRAEYRREFERIQTLLKPFITPGYMQPKSADELVYGQLKVPMSYSSLQRVGALKGTEQGIGTLFRIGGAKSASLNNDRPLGEFPRWKLKSNLQTIARLNEAQRLLRIYGPLMVEDGLLSP